jgi:signal transduction histidine kinase
MMPSPATGMPRRWLQRPWPQRRSIRFRLTLVYAALFLVSGATLLTITYLVVVQHGPGPVQVSVRGIAGAGGGAAGPVTSAGSCSGTGSAGSGPGQLGQCVSYLRNQVAAQRTGYLDTLLVASGVALGVMTLGALGLGWVVSGRALRPVRTITAAARCISASSLHQRLALTGPDDELKELGDTVDGLLARLEGSFAAQRQFVANASHELRTPLARQRTLIEVALADPDRGTASLEAACQRALAAGVRQERLIEALLTLARSQRGLDHYERVDLTGLVAGVSAARTAEAARRDVTVTVTAAGPALLFGDARLAERLIENLLDNAIKHNRPGGTVSLAVTKDEGQAVLQVANTGPVIPPGAVASLFEPFRRGRPERTGNGGSPELPIAPEQRTGDGDSPGLGLSIVAAIAAAHGASLWAVPCSSGGGLVVQVMFPRPPGQPPPVRISPAMPAFCAG